MNAAGAPAAAGSSSPGLELTTPSILPARSAAISPERTTQPAVRPPHWLAAAGHGLRNAGINIGRGLWRAPGTIVRVVMATPAAIRATPAALRATPRTAATAATNLWTLCDLRTMLQRRAGDPEFLRMIRNSDLEAGHAAFTIGEAQRQLRELASAIEIAPDIKPKFRNAALKEIRSIQSALNPLQHGTNPHLRAFKALVNLINLWPSIVPSPFFANQAKTFAYTVAAASKAVVGVAGNFLRGTADGWPIPMGGGEAGHHSNEVHFYPALLNAVYAFVYGFKQFGSEHARHRAEAIEHNGFFHGGVAVACGAILIAPFVWDHVQNAAGKARNAVVRGVASGLSIVERQEAAVRLREELTPGHVNAAVQQELTRIFTEFEAGRLALLQDRRNFTQSNELTRTLNSQVTRLLESMGALTDRLDAAFHLRPSDGTVARRSDANPDLAAKTALTVFAGLITGTTVALIQPDKIGTVDLAADALVVTAVMAQSAANKNATRQDAMERFKGMAATSMVMCLALGADKLAQLSGSFPKGLIESSSTAPYYAAAVMTVMAMTMPGPVARGAEIGLNYAGSKIVALFTDPQGRQLATIIPASHEDALRRVSEIRTHVASMSAEELEEYETTVGSVVLRTLRGSGTEARQEEAAGNIEEVRDTQRRS